MENPFAGLRPEMRSEHDEIRKGIFSRALRNMQFSPLEERREWCRAIRATYTAAQAAKQKRAAAAAATGPSPSSSSSPASPPGVAAASPPASSAEVGIKRPREGDEDSATSPSCPPAETAQGETASPGAASGPAPVVVDLSRTPEEEESEESVKECIAAYLRSLLDRVVGVSLENLNVPALRILCTMVGIKTEVRNKIALYSTLASFYYTECEKLGKRVSRDTIFERQVEHDVAMLKHVTPTTSSSTNKKNGDKKAAVNNEPAEAPVSARASKAAPAAVVVSVTSKRAAERAAVKPERKKNLSAPMPTTTSTATASGKSRSGVKAEHADVDHYLQYEYYDGELAEDGEAEGKPFAVHPTTTMKTTAGNSSGPSAASYRHQTDADEGEVVYTSRVFADKAAGPSSASSSSHMAKYAASASDDEWSTLMLERKVASIVQLHDPVTVAIVVKKLAQLGYRDSNAETTVEQILRRFHDRQLIFYDNGIAYLM